MIESGGQKLSNKIFEFIEQIGDVEVMLQYWTRGLIVPIPKMEN